MIVEVFQFRFNQTHSLILSNKNIKIEAIYWYKTRKLHSLNETNYEALAHVGPHLTLNQRYQYHS